LQISSRVSVAYRLRRRCSGATLPVLFWKRHGGSAKIVANRLPLANSRRLSLGLDTLFRLISVPRSNSAFFSLALSYLIRQGNPRTLAHLGHRPSCINAPISIGSFPGRKAAHSPRTVHACANGQRSIGLALQPLVELLNFLLCLLLVVPVQPGCRDRCRRLPVCRQAQHVRVSTRDSCAASASAALDRIAARLEQDDPGSSAQAQANHERRVAATIRQLEREQEAREAA
jgi:hypothetical protein